MAGPIIYCSLPALQKDEILSSDLPGDFAAKQNKTGISNEILVVSVSTREQSTNNLQKKLGRFLVHNSGQKKQNSGISRSGPVLTYFFGPRRKKQDRSLELR